MMVSCEYILNDVHWLKEIRGPVYVQKCQHLLVEYTSVKFYSIRINVAWTFYNRSPAADNLLPRSIEAACCWTASGQGSGYTSGSLPVTPCPVAASAAVTPSAANHSCTYDSKMCLVSKEGATFSNLPLNVTFVGEEVIQHADSRVRFKVTKTHIFVLNWSQKRKRGDFANYRQLKRKCTVRMLSTP